MATQKIISEVNTLIKDYPNLYHFQPNWEADPFNINLALKGPENSPYEGGLFSVNLQFTNSFPFKPPTIKFLTKIFHPEVDAKGRVCSECFLYDWGTKDIILGLLRKISAILKDPSPNCYISVEATELFTEDKLLFSMIASDWTRVYAI